MWGTWVEFTNRASDVPFSIYDDQSLLTTVDVNQKLAPAGMTTAGSTWQKLATVTVASGVLRVEVTGGAQAGPPGSDQGPGPHDDALYFVADAIRIVRADTSATGDANLADDGNDGYVESGSGWNSGSQAGGLRGDYRHAAAGSGANTATWSFDDLEEATYRVYVTWVPFTNRATNAPYTIVDGATTLQTVAVNQQSTPADNVATGAAWKSLGVFHVTSGY